MRKVEFIFILNFIISILLKAEEIISDFEYGKMLYENPRGVIVYRVMELMVKVGILLSIETIMKSLLCQHPL